MPKVKSPKELFEVKNLELSDHKEVIKTFDRNKTSNLLSPRKVFNDEIKSKNNNVEIFENLDKTLEIEESIDSSNFEDFSILSVSNKIDELKKQIESIKLYEDQISFVKKYIKAIESVVLNIKEFDPTDLYETILELKENINQVRLEIPEIPEPILYDDELDELKSMIGSVKNSIPIVPEVKYYDAEISSLELIIEDIKDEVSNLPKVKYYDSDIEHIEGKLIEIKNSIPILPEIKYYDEDINFLQSKIEEYKLLIPKIPEIKYYDDQIELIENSIIRIDDSVKSLPEVKYYDNDIKILNQNLKSLKNQIKSIPEVKYYDKDLIEIDRKIVDIKKTIPKVPEIKYYDDEISQINDDIFSLFEELSSLKIPKVEDFEIKIQKFRDEFDKKNIILNEKIKNLEFLFEQFEQHKERLLIIEDNINDIEYNKNDDVESDKAISPSESEKNQDPLTPTEKNFVTFEQLRDHYRLFINRVQQQLYSLGGGGETLLLTSLEDVVGIKTNPSFYDQKYLKYRHSIGKFEFDTVKLKGLSDIDLTNLSNGNMIIYDENNDKFIFVDPSIYFSENYGLNADFNIDPLIDDYGKY